MGLPTWFRVMLVVGLGWLFFMGGIILSDGRGDAMNTFGGFLAGGVFPVLVIIGIGWIILGVRKGR